MFPLFNHSISSTYLQSRMRITSIFSSRSITYNPTTRKSLTSKNFLVTTVLLSGVGVGYCYYMSNNRISATSSPEPKVNVKETLVLPPLPVLDSSKGPAFPADSKTVIFVLGGPGVGKGTQCSKLEREFGFVHISAGDLLREERKRPGSPYAELIEYYITEGKIVPHEITITLLLNVMRKHPEQSRFLIDGFPRTIEQGIEFEMVVCPSKMVMFFECPEEEMLKRLMGRSQNSGRSDDNIESIKKRFRVYQESTLPVREFYNDWGKLESINCSGSIDQVFERSQKAIKSIISNESAKKETKN